MSFQTIRLSKWEDIHQYARHEWLYRGHRCAGWELKTSLQRSCDRHGVAADKRRETEDALFREFRRAYHQYTPHVPSEKAVVEWLSLMQHHGAPTRLLDFSYSPYFSAYFAVEQGEGNCAVWAVRGPWALQESAKLLRAAGKPNVERMEKRFVEGDEEVVQSLFFEKPYVRAAWPINAFRLNERLRIQQGAFLIPGDVSQPFVANLEALPDHNDRDNIVELVIPHSERQTAIRNLFQMGISRTTLFPGLDGFAKSLGVYHPVVHDPLKWA